MFAIIYSIFSNWILLIYPKELEINETTETASSVSFLDIDHNFDTKCSTLYQSLLNVWQETASALPIINFPHRDIDIPTAMDWVDFSTRGCTLHPDFLQCQHFWVLNSMILKNRLILSFNSKRILSKYIKTWSKCLLSFEYKWWNLVLKIRFWFKNDYFTLFCPL